MERDATHREHAGEIQRISGYRDFNDHPQYFRLTRWIYLRSWLSAERPSILFDLATSWLVRNKVLLPGVTTLERHIASIRERTSARLWRILSAAPTKAHREHLESLLFVSDGERQSRLDCLRQGPTRVSGPSLVKALARFEEFRSLGVGSLDLAAAPPARVKALARYAASAWAPNVARMPDERRIATLLSFARVFEVTALDDAIDLLDLLISDILAEAEKLGRKERLRTIRDLDDAALTLKDVGRILLDDDLDEINLRQAIFARVSREELAEAVTLVELLARPRDERYEKELIDRYRRVRRFLPALLKTVTFKTAPSGVSVLRALDFLRSIEGQSRPDLSGAPLGVVPSRWWHLVVSTDKQIDRRAYTLCVVSRLQDALRRRDIFVPGSERWGDPRVKLLHGKAWESARPKICHTLGHQRTAGAELSGLERLLYKAYRRSAENLPGNPAVRISKENGKDTLVLSSLEKLPEPPRLLALRDTVAALLPKVDLPEALLEVHVRTGFADEFTHVSESDARVSPHSSQIRVIRDPSRSLDD